MRGAPHHAFGIRTAAKLVFGSFLFLFLASFLALPCMQADTGLFVSLASGPEAIVNGAQAVTRMSSLPPLRKSLSTAAIGASLLATPMPGTVPAASMQFASSWRDQAPLAASAQVAAAQPFFRRPHSAASCVEQKLFKPRMNVLKVFDAPMSGDPLRLLAVLAVVIGFGIVAAVSLRPRVRARPGWKRLRSLPFASSDPPRLPYFAAQRDA